MKSGGLGTQRLNALQRLARALQKAGKAEITRATSLDDGSLTFALDVDGVALTLNAESVRIVDGSLSGIEADESGLRRRYNRVKNADMLSIEELRERNLPLYWNEQWLREQLASHGTYTAIARKYGFPSASTIAAYAKRNFGINVQAEYDRKREDIVRRVLDNSEDVTHLELAREYGVAVATVYRWLMEARKTRREP